MTEPLKPWNEMTERERDCLVAEKVMGIFPTQFDFEWPAMHRYSTEISDTWTAACKFDAFDVCKEVDSYIATVRDYSAMQYYMGTSPVSAPDAICKAMLKAKRVDFSD